MTSKNKKLILTVICVIVVIILIVIIVKSNGNKGDGKDLPLNGTLHQSIEEKYVTIVENEGISEKHNNSEDFKKTKTYNNLEISNINFTSKGGMSYLHVDVKNVGSEKHNKEKVEISILDENNKLISALESEIADIEPGETKKMSVVVTADIVNAKDFTIKSK